MLNKRKLDNLLVALDMTMCLVRGDNFESDNISQYRNALNVLEFDLKKLDYTESSTRYNNLTTAELNNLLKSINMTLELIAGNLFNEKELKEYSNLITGLALNIKRLANTTALDTLHRLCTLLAKCNIQDHINNIEGLNTLQRLSTLYSKMNYKEIKNFMDGRGVL